MYVLALISLLLSARTQAATEKPRVAAFLSENTLCVEGIHEIREQVSFAVESRRGNIIAFLRWTAERCGNAGYVMEVKAHPNAPLVLLGDSVRVFDLSKESQDLPGRYDLLTNKNKHILPQYKNLVYLGHLASQSAAILDKNEFLLGPSLLAMGVSDRLQISTTSFLNFTSVPNAGAKFVLFDSDDYRFSVAAQALYFPKQGKVAFDGDAYLDVYSNGHFISYQRVTVRQKRPEDTPLEAENLQSSPNTEIQSVQGIILSNWNRILVGPKYSFQTGTLGGHAAYMMFFKRFHLLLGLQTNDIRRWKLFSARGYVPYLDFFWRL